jgi:plastocyanin
VSRLASPLALAALLALGLGPNAPVRAATGPVTIEIDHFVFSPAEITVEAGTIVEWVNHDQTIHNIILTTAKVASPGMDTGDHYAYKFDALGDFPYLCGLHPHMTGVVHVRPHA